MSDAPAPAAAPPAAAAPATLNPTDSIQLQRDMWANRRRMGFTSLWTIIAAIPLLFLLCSLVSDEVVARVVQLQALMIGLIVPLVGLAGAYMGLATVYGANAPPNMTVGAPTPPPPVGKG